MYNWSPDLFDLKKESVYNRSKFFLEYLIIEKKCKRFCMYIVIFYKIAEKFSKNKYT